MGALSSSLQFSGCALHLCFGVGGPWRDGEFIIPYSSVGSSLARGTAVPCYLPLREVVWGIRCMWLVLLLGNFTWRGSVVISDHTEAYCSHFKKKNLQSAFSE